MMWSFKTQTTSAEYSIPPPRFLYTLGNEKKMSAVGLYCDYENLTEKFFIDGIIFGINFWAGGALKKNTARPLIKNLDDNWT